MKKLLLFATFLFLIYCCTKQNANDNRDSTELQPRAVDYLPGKCPYPCTDTRCKAYLNGYCGSDTIAIIKNSNNQYDYIGQEHNNGVESILPSIGSPTNLDSATLVKVESYLVTLGYSADSFQIVYNNDVAAGFFPFSQVQELDSLGNTMYSKGLIDTYTNAYVQDIYGYGIDYLNNDTVTDAEYTSFADDLISLESTIKNDTRISTAEKQTLLACCAVARYSASFWANYFDGGAYNDAIRPLFLKALSKFWKVVICDAAGALINIKGGWLGIIGGAVGSSIVAAVTINNNN